VLAVTVPLKPTPPLLSYRWKMAHSSTGKPVIFCFRQNKLDKKRRSKDWRSFIRTAKPWHVLSDPPPKAADRHNPVWMSDNYGH